MSSMPQKVNTRKLDKAITDTLAAIEKSKNPEWKARFENILDVLYLQSGRRITAPQGKALRGKRIAYLRKHPEVWRDDPPNFNRAMTLSELTGWRDRNQVRIVEIMRHAGLYSITTNPSDVNLISLLREVHEKRV